MKILKIGAEFEDEDQNNNNGSDGEWGNNWNGSQGSNASQGRNASQGSRWSAHDGSSPQTTHHVNAMNKYEDDSTGNGRDQGQQGNNWNRSMNSAAAPLSTEKRIREEYQKEDQKEDYYEGQDPMEAEMSQSSGYVPRHGENNHERADESGGSSSSSSSNGSRARKRSKTKKSFE